LPLGSQVFNCGHFCTFVHFDFLKTATRMANPIYGRAVGKRNFKSARIEDSPNVVLKNTNNLPLH